MEKMRAGQAVVVKHTGSHYLISELPKWELMPVVIKGKMRLNGVTTTNPVAVGDLVDYEIPVDEAGRPSDQGVIKSVHPRRNYIIRKSTNLSKQTHVIAANLDRAFLVVTMDFPETKWPFIDRFLLCCEVYRVPVTIVLNKIDLYDEDSRGTVDYFEKIYRAAGYEVLETSAVRGIGIGRLKELTADGVSLVSGVSGVGKSSLLQALDPGLHPRIAGISQSHLQGRHTTTFYEMYPLENGGFLIDTPGIRGFGIVDLETEEISKYFPEMLRVMDHCRYIPCTHTHEPGCAVKAAVEEGTISAERYSSYLGMLEEETKYR